MERISAESEGVDVWAKESEKPNAINNMQPASIFFIMCAI